MSVVIREAEPSVVNKGITVSPTTLPFQIIRNTKRK